MVAHKATFDAGEVERLVILVVVILGAEVFIPVVEHILLEETHKVFEKFKAVLSQFIAELATDDDNAPVGVVAHALYLQLIYYADDIVRLGTEIYWLNKKVCF
jgi:hypothetical protein